MGKKNNTVDKVIKKITKKGNADKILGSVVNKVVTSVENNAEKKMKQEEKIEKEERKLQAKLEKSIENIKNYKVENTGEAVINFLIEAKKNIKNKNIEPDEYKMWILKIDEVYEKAQESITDKEKLDKISLKYKELKNIEKNKRFEWIAFSYILIALFIILLNESFVVGLGISILVGSIITFVYFNIDFSNISKSIKEFRFKGTLTNIICIVLSIFAIVLISFGIVSNLLKNAEINRGKKNYYDENSEKYNISIEVDFKDNILFNRCDITLKMYDKEENFEHGEDKIFEIGLPKGSHQLEFNGNDDVEIRKIKIDGDTKLKYKLECLSDGIKVTQVSKEN